MATNERVDGKLREPLTFAAAIAEKSGYVLNPDEAQLDRLARHLAENKAKHGRYFCPCKQHYPLEPENDPVCPCPTFREEIARQGHCECHLFFSPEAAARVARRPGLLATVTCPG
ncbi:MAG: ferredoxin:thioredoxin reductase [Kiritimatiellae bacterium]|nr:ferredoxin:thioredoxin reductase [Kiritimatiellia bacterium]